MGDGGLAFAAGVDALTTSERPPTTRCRRRRCSPTTLAALPARPTANPNTIALMPVERLASVNRWTYVVGGVVFAVLMALSPRYGFHRDELYFLDSARHLQASYVDQPVLTPLLAWVSLKLFGVSLAGLRLWPALAAGATVVISGLTRGNSAAAAARSCWPRSGPDRAGPAGRRPPGRHDPLRRAGLDRPGPGGRPYRAGPATAAGGWPPV